VKTSPDRFGGHDTLPGRPCSIAAALHLVGERWALLAVRELIFGNHRFDQIARNTGAPRDRLTSRLRSLEDAGIIERRRYSDRPPRHEYHLTEAGRELAPVIHALRTWGDRWAIHERPIVLEHSCGHEFDPAPVCRHCGNEILDNELTIRPTTPGWDLHGPLT
jgi:DNA-binding HxlR family transcriptional regulator